MTPEPGQSVEGTPQFCMRRSTRRVGEDAAERPIIATSSVYPDTASGLSPQLPQKQDRQVSQLYAVSRITITNPWHFASNQAPRIFYPAYVHSNLVQYPLFLRTYYVIVTVSSWRIPARIL